MPGDLGKYAPYTRIPNFSALAFRPNAWPPPVALPHDAFLYNAARRGHRGQAGTISEQTTTSLISKPRRQLLFRTPIRAAAKAREVSSVRRSESPISRSSQGGRDAAGEPCSELRGLRAEIAKRSRAAESPKSHPARDEMMALPSPRCPRPLRGAAIRGAGAAVRYIVTPAPMPAHGDPRSGGGDRGGRSG